MKGAALAVAAPMIQRGRFCLLAEGPPAPNEAVYSTLALDLVRRSTVIDMLGLLTLNYRKLTSWEADPRRFGEADFQRLKNSGITVFHPAVGYTAGDIYNESLRDITGWNAFIQTHGEEFQHVESVAHFKQAKALGKVGILIGQQNSAHFRSVE